MAILYPLKYRNTNFQFQDIIIQFHLQVVLNRHLLIHLDLQVNIHCLFFFFNYCSRTATIISVVYSTRCKEWTYFENIFPHIYVLIHTIIQIFPHYVSLENISVWIINFCWSRIEIFIRMYKMCDYLYHLFIYTHTLLPLHDTCYIRLATKMFYFALDIFTIFKL